jgi:hypothetical protein
MADYTNLLNLINRLEQDAYCCGVQSDSFWRDYKILESNSESLIEINNNYQRLRYRLDRHIYFDEPFA